MCDRRAPVQADERGTQRVGAGTVTWMEHEQAWQWYAGKYGSDQTAERIAERGGFGYFEMADYLGRQPSTWRAR